MDLIREFWEFIKERRKLWLAPIILLLLLIIGLSIVAAAGGGLSPFIYMLW
ncbi:MAG: hypothetical protein KDK34_03395 [Leptospiraceae bacterium]|nr:hypothetical protein [Leptospiraceae bacterium]MCB1319270.1 hypothetical protein [Leptospiraceae bacterium]